jgi:formylglycine-generating enzyme required for sulfatase activity
MVPRGEFLRRFREGRNRSKRFFEIPLPEAYCSRPISLRNPIVFYEGHLPAFTVNTLIKLALKRGGIDETYETLFERGIDPEDESGAAAPADLWPSRRHVQTYGVKADAMIERAICEEKFDHPLHVEALHAIVEHELMHQETLLYMFHNMLYEQKRVGGCRLSFAGKTENDFVPIPAGPATLGQADAFGWDNEFPRHVVEVLPFEIQRHNVTNGEYLDYMRVTGAPPPHFWLRKDGAWFWRGMFELIPLPPSWPVYATYDEASAYARWLGGRVPREEEYHRAAFGSPSGEERPYPWGDQPPDSSRGNFDFVSWEPVPVGSYPAGASAWGVHDLVGNGWEWTSTAFNGFDGFKPMESYPVYSTDFFDGRHYVLKGASPATSRDLVRRSFRNWFRPNYPYLYATFRCAR